MMLVTTTVEHDGRGFTVRSTLGDDCRLAMLRAFVRAAVDQAGGEVNPDARELADWLTEEVGRTSPRTASQLLRQLAHAGDLTRRRVGNSWYYAPTPAQQVMIAAIGAPPRRRERIPSASHTSAGVQPERQVAAPPRAGGVRVDNLVADQPVAHSDAGEMQVRCTVADAPSAPPDANGAQVGRTVVNPVADASDAPSDASLTASLSPESDPTEVWNAVLGRLKLEIPKEYFNTYLKPCVGDSWTGHSLVVAVDSKPKISWLELPLHYDMAVDALAQVIGRKAAIDYEFEPHAITQAPPPLASTVEPDLTSDPAPAVTSEWHCPDHPNTEPKVSKFNQGQLLCGYLDHSTRKFCKRRNTDR